MLEAERKNVSFSLLTARWHIYLGLEETYKKRHRTANS